MQLKVEPTAFPGQIVCVIYLQRKSQLRTFVRNPSFPYRHVNRSVTEYRSWKMSAKLYALHGLNCVRLCRALIPIQDKRAKVRYSVGELGGWGTPDMQLFYWNFRLLLVVMGSVCAVYASITNEIITTNRIIRNLLLPVFLHLFY